MAAWPVSQVQVVFWGYRAPIDVETLLTKLGVKPTRVEKTQGVSMASGPAGQISYRVQSSPGRLDVIAQPDAVGDELPLFQDLDAIRACEESVARLPDFVGAVARVAVVVSTLKPVESEAEAAGLLCKESGITLPFSDAADFIFQVNRRKKLESGPTVNRILKLESLVIRLMRVENGVNTSIRDEYAAGISADVNTVAEAGSRFEPPKQRRLLAEMFAQARHMTENQNMAALV